MRNLLMLKMNIHGLCLVFIGLCFIDKSFETNIAVRDSKPRKDDEPVGTLPTINHYIPAVVQALQYYIEMLQYEQLQTTTVEPPLGDQYTKPPVDTSTESASTTYSTTTTTTTATIPTTRRTTTQRPTTSSTTTTQSPVSTTSPTFIYSTILDIWFLPETSTQRHRPGYYSPEKPPVSQQKPTTTTTTRRPTTTTTTSRPTTRETSTRPQYTRPTETRPTFTRPSVTRPQYTRPVTTRLTRRPTNIQTSTISKPIYTRPTRQPSPPVSPVIAGKPEQTYESPTAKPQKPQEMVLSPNDEYNDNLNEPNWQDPTFVNWFFQKGPQNVQVYNEEELQYLSPLPKKLLLDLQRYYSKPPALLATDNIAEFRKVFDDSYNRNFKSQKQLSRQEQTIRQQMQTLQNRPMITGKKKVPVTKPFVEFLMLFDLLKREAKELNLHRYGGYGAGIMEHLVESSSHSSDWQLHFLLSTMLARNETQKPEIIKRSNVIISDLENSSSVTSKALRFIPSLVFLP